MNSNVKFLTTIFKELGLPGFLIVIATCIFLVYSSAEQKLEWIDKFILMKEVEQNPLPFSLVVLFLLIIIIFGGFYFQRRINILEKENKRIGKQKSIAQEAALKTKLSSSE